MVAGVCARRWRLWLMLVVAAAVILPCATTGTTSRRAAPTRQKLEVQRHLKKLNKQAIKSIKVAPFSLSFLLIP